MRFKCQSENAEKFHIVLWINKWHYIYALTYDGRKLLQWPNDQLQFKLKW